MENTNMSSNINNNWKNNKVWKIVGVIVVLLILAKIFCGGGHGYPGDRQNISTISVTGKGEVIVKPDIATISFGVSAENLDVAKAQTDSATKINAIIDFLKKNGVDEKDIKTINYSIYPRYDYPRVMTASIYPNGGTQVLAGYVVSQDVEVKIRAINNAGAIISGVGGLGATNVSSLTFSVDNIDEVRDQARDAAIKDARAQAKVLAGELGVRLAKITSFSESGNTPIYYGGMEKAVMSMAADSVAPQVPAGENKITSNVTITYEIR